MLYRDRHSLYLFLLLYPATLFSGDKHAGKVYFEDPVTGTISMTGGAPKMPGVPMDITPNIPDAPTGGGSNGWGGFLGLIVNLGRTSEADKRAADIADKAARELRARTIAPGVAGIPVPRTPKEEAALLKQLTQQAQAFNLPAPVSTNAPDMVAPVVKAVAPAVAAAVVTKVASSAPASPPVYSFRPGMPGGITCLPPFDTESFGSGVSAVSSSLAPAMPPKAPPIPDFSQLLRDNPFKDLPGKGGGGGAAAIAGGVLGVKAVATTATTTTVATTAGTVATTTGAGWLAGTTVSGMTVGAATIYLAPFFLGGIALGVGVVATYEFFARPKDAVFFAKKPVANIPQYIPNSPQNNVPNSPNPQKPNEPKERKFNKVQRTEAMNRIKENYRYDKQHKAYTLKDNGTPIKCTRTGKTVKHIDWDGQHGDIEAYVHADRHLGSLDPENFSMYKGPVSGREL